VLQPGLFLAALKSRLRTLTALAAAEMMSDAKLRKTAAVSGSW
jgi:hypothetical protein